MAIKRALISVSDKTGVVEFAKGLHDLGVEIISTGGTMKAIAAAGIPVKSVSEVTGFPEMMDGRVKTLHPMIHGGILAIRDNPEHVKAMKEHGIKGIDLVAVNLYPFRETIAKPGVTRAEAIENIDIGGPSMVRAAAKNYKYVTIVVDPSQYDEILERIKNDTLDEDFRLKLSRKAFLHTGLYDCAIANYLTQEVDGKKDVLPDVYSKAFVKIQDLRYGENPHQAAKFYGKFDNMFDQLHGKEISYNNLLDIDSAVNLIDEFDELTFAILKHNNACGIASRGNVVDAWKDALAGDPVSAFGGILITNTTVNKEVAEEINKIFFEVIIAPAYDADALEVLKQKKNRIILVRKECKTCPMQFRSLLNGVLIQEKDLSIQGEADLEPMTEKKPTALEVEDLLFANKIVKNSKSNAITLVKNKQLCASGIGQTSRVDSLKQAIEKAVSFNFDLNGAVMASDAFFPFADCVEIADKEGITAVIQPGGSVKDDLSFAYCNEHGMAMVTTGIRHFKH